MPQGNYDHPSYLTRQYDFIGKTTAGANSLQTALYAAYPNAIRLRNAAALVNVAGTSATTGNAVQVLCIGTCTQISTAGVQTVGTGTTTLGSIVLGTSAANTFGT